MKTNPNDFINPQDTFYQDTPTGNAGGLTIRQYFAAMAMQARIGTYDNTRPMIHDGLDDFHDTALMAVKFADALIAELNKETEK